MRTFHPPKTMIEMAMAKLKHDGVVHPDARINYEAENGPRKEVTCRDDDFQCRLGLEPVCVAPGIPVFVIGKNSDG